MLLELLGALLVLVSIGLAGFWALANYWFQRSTSKARSERKRKLMDRAGSPVAVVIAARDEEERLPLLLAGLMRIGYPLVEIIVVDDESSDATPRIVENLSLVDKRIKLIRIKNRPAGWAPKPYALHTGAKSVEKAETILFMDADTRIPDPQRFQLLIGMSPGDAEIVALVPRFHCTGFYCKAAQAYMTATAHAFYGFHRVANPHDKLAWMYGCCWMISKAYYNAIGGHSIVKNSVVEDRDFASKAKSMGAKITPVDAVDTVEVEAYETPREYRSLIARLTLDRARRLGSKRIIIDAILIAFIHLAPCAWPIPLLLGDTLNGALLLAAWILQKILYAFGSLYNNYSIFYSLPALAAGLPPSMLGVLDTARKKRVVWRGRAYS